jgi:hypothetical protein
MEFGMISPVYHMLLGATAMASLVAAFFFAKFWQQTRDRFFLFFAIGFGLDAATRLLLGVTQPLDEYEPLVYLARLVTFALIIVAIIDKNRPGRSSGAPRSKE